MPGLRVAPGWRQGLLGVVLVLAAASPGLAQEETVLSRARALAAAGQRPEALAMLESHLAATPKDVDARLVYGLVLSWERRYDDARRELQQVLQEAPAYADARVALMNVDYWSGRTAEARQAAEVILASTPGQEQARFVRDQLDAADRPWGAGVEYSADSFSDDRDSWYEAAIVLTRRMPVGTLVGRINQAERFGDSGSLFEVEFYPRFRPGTYAYLSAGGSDGNSFYPSSRFGVELYQALGRGFEASAGFRRLNADTATEIYIGTLTKYVGNWMITGKVFHIPDATEGATSFHGSVRRYVRGDGVSYAGATYSHGLSREEVRNLADFVLLNSEAVRGETVQLFRARVRLFAAGAVSRQERQSLDALWQITVTSGLTLLF